MLITLSHRISTCLRDNEAAMGRLDHSEWRRALYQAVLAAVRRGDFPQFPADEHTARIIANYAATDMALTGRSLWLPAHEIEAVRQCEAIRAGVESSIGRRAA